MSIDYNANGSHQSLFSQNDIDHSFSSIQAGDLSSGAAHSGSHLSHSLERSESLDVPDHPSYDIFASTGSSGSLASQRYRNNASSSSSLGPSYPLGVDTMYPPSSYPDSLPSFHSNSHPYDIISSLPSSYSSGKPSPLTPNDVSGLPHHSSFPFSNGQSKDFPSQGYHDPILDRRMSGANGSFSDFNDEFGNMGVGSNLGLSGYHGPSALQGFQDRLGRETRYPGSTVPPLSTSSHLSQNHDLIRGVAPQATHFRPEGGLPPFDEMPQFMAPNPQVDYPLRMPSVDENMARLRLQGAGDVQTFIRYVRDFLMCRSRLFPEH